MEKVTLYDFKSDQIRITMEIYFNEKNQLIFDGYDAGQMVKKLRGASDYEYYYTIEMPEVLKIAAFLEVDTEEKSAILEGIKKQFSGDKAYSKFGDFMRARDIVFTTFTW